MKEEEDLLKNLGNPGVRPVVSCPIHLLCYELPGVLKVLASEVNIEVSFFEKSIERRKHEKDALATSFSRSVRLARIVTCWLAMGRKPTFLKLRRHVKAKSRDVVPLGQQGFGRNQRTGKANF